MTMVVATTAIVGMSSGRMILRKICTSLAPSTRAASSSSVLMPLRPGRQDDHREAGQEPDADDDEEQVVPWLFLEPGDRVAAGCRWRWR